MATPVNSDQDHGDVARITNLPTPVSDTEAARMIDILQFSGKNLLHNGDFAVLQRGSSFVAGANGDGAYTADRWCLLTDGADIVDVIFQTPIGLGIHDGRVVRLDIETANKKFALAQFVENEDVLKIRGKEVTLSFAAWQATGSNIQHVKCAVLAFDGALGNAFPHDIIVSWNANNTQPTLATNWTYVGTPVTLALTDAPVQYSTTVTVPNGADNLAVILWSDSTASTVGHFLYARNFQLEMGAQASSFELVPYATQLAQCQRFYEVLRYSSWSAAAVSHYRAASNYSFAWAFKATKMRAPTIAVVTGAWAGCTPTIYPGIEHTDFYTTTAFYAPGTSGSVALSASAEL
jgi:hypothetical protein